MSHPSDHHGPQYPPHGAPNPGGQPPGPPHSYGAPPPNPYGPPRMPPPAPPKTGRVTGLFIGLVALVLLVGAAGAVAVFMLTEEDSPPCVAAAGEDTLLACSPSLPPGTEKDPDIHPQAVDLTEGLGPFDPDSGDYAAVTAEEDLWIPVGDPSEWSEESLPSDPSRSVWVKNGTTAFYTCADAERRGGSLPDFTDYQAAFDFVSGQYIDAQTEEAEFAQRNVETFTHYVIDGRAAYLAEAEFAWTVDNNGISVDTIDYWGFVAVNRGEAPPLICTFSAYDSVGLYEETVAIVLGLRALE